MTANKIIKLTPFRADLTRAMACRGERLLTSPNLAAEVANLAPLEAYYIVREIGLDLALPIILQLDQEQLESCIDLDCWQGSDFTVDRLDEWLKAYAQAGPEALARGFFALDYVVQLLFLSQTVTVYDPDTDQVPPENTTGETPRVVTPDGFFVLELKSAAPLKIHPYTLLDALYKNDSHAAFQLLSQVRVDLSTQIEEEALRFRNGRMEDIGFAGPDEANILFSRPPARHKSPGRHPDSLTHNSLRLPALYAAPLSESSLLERALSQVTDPECLARLEQEVVWVINSAITAYGEKTQDIKQISDIAERVRDTISLGLETLLAKQGVNCLLEDSEVTAQATDLLELWTLTDLFRHGFAASQELQHQVKKAMDEPRFRNWYNLSDPDQSDEPLDRMERAFVTALRGRHPLRGGIDPAQDDAVTAFTNLTELRIAQERLKELVTRICLQE